MSRETLEFRPPASLRMALGMIGLLTAISAMILTLRSLSRYEPAGIALSVLLLAPTSIALSVLSRQYLITHSEVRLQLPWTEITIPFARIRFVDESRGSVKVDSASRALIVMWLTPKERDRLVHAIVDRARLIRSMDPPFGVRARYVPRTQDIGFTPHHARRPIPPESEDVVS